MENWSDSPTFLVAAERSGTTLLRYMLDHHPLLSWCGGFTFAVERIAAPGQWPRRRDYYRYLETNRVFQSSGFTIDSELTYPALIHSFLRQHRERAGKPRVGANVYRHFERLRWLFPSCRFIHLLRDPRGVSRSWVALGWSGNVWGAVRHWLEAEQQWEALRPTLRPEQYYEVRYESLIAAPEVTLRGLCGFIGIDYSTRMLAYPDDTAYAPPDAGLVGRWQQQLSPREVQLVEARAAEMLQVRGYASSGLPPLRVTCAQRQWLREDDRFRRVRARIKTNGWTLVASEWLARRLHLGPWWRHLARRVNAIEMQSLK